MKVLTLHCDYIKFKPLKKAISSAEELTDKEEKNIKEALVVFTAVESEDNDDVFNDYLKSVKKTFEEVKAKKIVIYPYAHLSSNLASPEVAKNYLARAERELKNENFDVVRAPFGYYKSFELKCKGHPLSELSKEFRSSKKVEIKKFKEESYQTEKLLKEISRTKLDTSKLKENDHRILGQKLEFFNFNESSPGTVFWHNNGLIVFNELKKFIQELLIKFDYQEIATPQILDNKLWKISGHWEHYKNNMFILDYEGRDFGIKPMNCPGAILVYKTKTRSYKELPLRLSEFGIVHRKELSGVLSGLFRLIQFTQDDAHIFCTREQVEKEVEKILEMIEIIFKDTFNFDYSLELSTMPDEFMGEIQDWEFTEKTLEKILKKSKVNYKVNKKAGAFYGPKIDLHANDSLGRSWQLSTIQLDMQMPKRFDLSYVAEDNKTYKPFLIHRAILGSIERFIGILIEHLNGNLPVWLSPIQTRVINFTDRNIKAAEKVYEKLKEIGIRVDKDFRNTTVSDKVRDAELQKIPYIIVIGDKEEKNKTLALRARGKKPEFNVKFESFAKEIREKIERRKH